jgi:CHAT domain-containing protein/tetratricopeptide (TPR) repeat protein
MFPLFSSLEPFDADASGRRRRKRPFGFALLSVALPLFALLSVAPAVVRAQSAQTPPIEREIGGGELHSMRLSLTAGQFVRAVFDQRGVDIVLVLLGPDGRELTRVDSPVGEWGPEPLFFEVGTTGYYTIQVRPRRESAGPGRYEFTMTVGHATPRDERQFPAERAFAAATRALSGGEPDALRKSLEKYEEALSLFRAVGDYRGEVTTLTTMAAVSQALGEGAKALRYYGDALALLRTTNDTGAEARALVGVALVYFSLGDRDRALNNFRQALALFRAAGDNRTAAYTLNNIGHVYDSRGEEREALGKYEQSLPLFRAVNDKRGEAIALNHIGLVYDALGDKAQARAHFKEALAVFEAVGDCREVGPALSNLAADALESGDREKALEYLNHALAVQHAAGDREGEATTLNNLGFVYYTSGDSRKGFEHFHRALALDRETRNRTGEGDTLSNMMFAWRAQGKAGLAVFHGKQAVTAYQEVRRTIPPLDKEAQKSFLRPREIVYHQLAEILIEQGRLPEAQQVVGFLKEEEYFQFVRRDAGEGPTHAATLTPTETAVEKRYQEIADQITVRGRQRSELLQKSARTPEEDKQLAQLDTELSAAGQAFQNFLDQLAVELGNTKQASKVDQVRDSQGLMEDLRELGAGAVAIYTLVGEEKLRVILVTPDVQVAREYPVSAADLNKKVAAFREALQNPQTDPRPAAQELYRIVVGPIAKDLEQAHAETLMWSLDGALRYVPMAALHDGERYMVERYRNVVFTPASMTRLKDEPSAQWRALGFGVSKAYGEFAALPAVPDELRGIIHDDGAGDVGGVLPGKIALDNAFTAESFRAGLRQRFPLVHVASHFQFQPGNDTDSFLLLGDGSQLTLAQIKTAQNLFGGVDLLTLSACNTATGDTGGDGKEVESFAVLAQRQGAKAVVASLWPVADVSTRLLMQEFYRLHNEQPGMLKAESLRQAQLELLRGEAGAAAVEQGGKDRGPEPATTARRGLSVNTLQLNSKAPFSHPYFWAPFILIGNWR